MPSGAYYSPNAVCPFYQWDIGRPTKIKCEGLTEGGTIDILFKNIEQKKSYMGIYCETNFTLCGIYKAINEKYKGEK